MEESEILTWNQKGIFPGPLDTESSYAAYIQELKKNLDKEGAISRADWDWSREHLRALFDVDPLYFPAFYSNRLLAPWQAAASWFEGKKFLSIQLREAFRKGSFLKWYQRDEILSHEAVHASRAPLESRRFEEFFAYMSSEKRWQKVLGPIVRRPWEVWPLFLFLMLAQFWSFGFFFAAIWLAIGFFRLIFSHIKLKKAAAQIEKELKSPKKTRAVLFRLTDEEILLFAKGASLVEYARKEKSFRWKVICLAYQIFDVPN